MVKPEISIIIPCGRRELVAETLRGLAQQTIPATEYAVYLVTPSDRELENYLAENITIIKTDRLYPPGEMRNKGAAGSAGEILAFIDDDCVPPPEWLGRMKEAMLSAERVAAVGCRVVNGEHSFWNRCADYCLFGDYQGFDDRQGPLGSAAIFVRRRAFSEAGGFDAGLLASEDWEFSLRLQKSGWRCLFLSKVEVRHDHGRGSFPAIMRNSYRSGLRSGLVVQEKFKDSVSWLARLSLWFKSPWLYWLIILPYGSAVAVLQALTAVKCDAGVILYFPVMLASRLAYHCGVWRRLIADSLGQRVPA